MRDLVELYFKDRSIVNHHISSFNDFLPTLDNPNSRMQKIVDNLRVSAEDMDRGIIRLDPDKTDGRIIEIRVGRKRDDRGNIDQGAKPTIKVKLPENREADGSTHPLTPMEARLRNLNYLSPIFLDFTIVEDGIEKEPEKDVHIGDLPIMVKSKKCTLYKENLEEEREISDEEYWRILQQKGEDPMDPGGYFIIGGTERVLITLEDLAPNRVMVETNERYGTELEVAKVFSQKEGHRALTLVEKKRDGMLMVTVPAASGQIPLVALMKALGMESDQEIFEAIVSEERMANIVYANIEEMPGQEDLPPERHIHHRGRHRLPGAQVRHRPGQGVPGEEGRVHHRPLVAAPLGRHPGGPPEEGHLPRPYRPVRAGAVLGHAQGGRQGPLRQQAPEACWGPHGGPVPRRLHQPHEGPEVPAGTVLCQEEGPAHR